jgi:transposase
MGAEFSRLTRNMNLMLDRTRALMAFRYKSRNRKIMFGRLKDWRRVATRYDRCPTVFLSAIALAATVLFWL